MKKVGFVYHPIYLEHNTGTVHPERSSRLEAILRQLKRDEMDSKLIEINAFEAPLKWIEEVHDINYINHVQSSCDAGTPFLGTEDCPLSPKTYESALWASGGFLSAIDSIMSKKIDRAFCAVRPPGHHAEHNRAMGFCFFNNIAVGARYLQKEYDLEKIFILDWDVHHGNGTQHSFEQDPTVFYSSIHEDPRYCYPGTGFEAENGIGKGQGATLNCPMTPESNDEDYKAVFAKVIKAIKNFKPDFILISAGFDAHKDDPLAHINITEAAFTFMTEGLIEQADSFCEGRIASVLEGGYNLTALGKSVSSHIKAMMS